MSDKNSNHPIAKPKKSPDKILDQQIDEAVEQHLRPALSLFISGISAGLDIGFSLLLITSILHLLPPDTSPLLTRTLTAFAYSAGFIFVILGRTELFTEHTTLAVIPFLDRQITFLQLLRLWGIVLVANLLGTGVFAWLTSLIAPQFGLTTLDILAQTAQLFISHSWNLTFLSAVLAGWLMGLLSWLITASRNTTSQIFLITLITSTKGFLHLHHSVIGTTLVLAGLFASPSITWNDYFNFLTPTVIGNIIGGSFFVALIKYGHVTLTRKNYQLPILR